MHVHLEHDRCLEVIVLKGRSDVLRDVSDRLIATPGVLHGRLELFTDLRAEGPRTEAGHRHAHEPDHRHEPRTGEKPRARKKR
jgi:CopG family nickel-responsive transcriptional regulator